MGKKTLFSWLSTVTGPWEQAWVITLSLVAQLLLSASERAKYFIRLHMQGPRQGNNTPYLFCFFFAGQIPFIGTFSFLARALQPFLHGICRADVLENCLFTLSSPTFLLFSAYLLPLPTIRPFLAETVTALDRVYANETPSAPAVLQRSDRVCRNEAGASWRESEKIRKWSSEQ